MSIPVTVTIKEEQREWLFKHPEINVSGLMQKGIIELMKKEKEGVTQNSQPRPNSVSRRRSKSND